MGFRELPGWETTIPGHRLSVKRSSFARDLTPWTSSSGCWFLSFIILCDKLLICASCSNKLIKPKEGLWESLINSQSVGVQVTSWDFNWHLRGDGLVGPSPLPVGWDSISTWYQNWGKFSYPAGVGELLFGMGKPQHTRCDWVQEPKGPRVSAAYFRDSDPDSDHTPRLTPFVK